MSPDASLISAVQALVALPFLALGCLGLNLIVLWTVSQTLVRRRSSRPAPPPVERDFPRVLIQLPVFNEATVVARIVRAAAALDWPLDRLKIQLLDDSTDGTTEMAARAVAEARLVGVDIEHVRRLNRVGFKAGALAEGLERDDAEFIAIFDADFVPASDFLRRALAPLIADPSLGFVQARWEHLNAGENQLTASQAMMIDAHFVVEQRVRSDTRLVLPFNGTCGVWRRAAIDAAGGWSADTLCEDLDLSIRARLHGWRGVFLPDLAVPGELPATVAGWRAQQFRWTKGFVQVARKLFGPVWRSDLPLVAKIGFTMQTAQTACYPLTALSVLGSLVAFFEGRHGALIIPVIGGVATTLGIGGSALCLFTAGIVYRRFGWVRLPINFATILLLNAGLLVSNSRAVGEALIGAKSPFVRTPKRGAQIADRTPTGASLDRTGPTGLGELGVGSALALALAWEAGWLSPLFSVTIGGLMLVGFGLARERWRDTLRTPLPRRPRAALTSDQPVA